MFYYFCIFTKVFKVNNYPLGKNSPNQGASPKTLSNNVIIYSAANDMFRF
jgi:hypothetical protein